MIPSPYIRSNDSSLYIRSSKHLQLVSSRCLQFFLNTSVVYPLKAFKHTDYIRYILSIEQTSLVLSHQGFILIKLWPIKCVPSRLLSPSNTNLSNVSLLHIGNLVRKANWQQSRRGLFFRPRQELHSLFLFPHAGRKPSKLLPPPRVPNLGKGHKERLSLRWRLMQLEG